MTTPEIALASTPQSEREPAIAWLGPKYLVAWSKAGAGVLEADLEGITVDPVTCLPCGQPFSLPRPATGDFGPAIASQAAAHGSPPSTFDQALIVFTSAALAPPFQAEVRAQRFEAIGSGGSVQNVGGGCGASYAASQSGPFAIGNTSLLLRVTGVLGASAVLLDIGLPGPPLSCGTCQVTPPIVALPARLGGDLAELPFPIPCSFADLIGTTVELQWGVLGAPQPICPLAPPLTFSDRLHATVGW